MAAAACDVRQTDPEPLPVLHDGALVITGLRCLAAHPQPTQHILRAAAVADLGILRLIIIGPKKEKLISKKMQK